MAAILVLVVRTEAEVVWIGSCAIGDRWLAWLLLFTLVDNCLLSSIFSVNLGNFRIDGLVVNLSWLLLVLVLHVFLDKWRAYD